MRKASLGSCVVNIGSKRLTPDSHAIIISNTPTAQEEYAAKDLQNHLELLTGQVIPILKDTEVGDRIPIIIGKSNLLQKFGVEVDTTTLVPDGIFIKTVGPALILIGAEPRGTLYACYTFLEDYLKFRWLTPDCTVFPKKGTFNIEKIDLKYIPPLEYREPYSFVANSDADWAVRNKVNGHGTKLDAQRGGKIIYKGFVHTFYSLVPPEKYFDEHPEYFSEIDGQRRYKDNPKAWGGGQLCLTNPEVENIVVENIRKWLSETPDANIVSVSQQDAAAGNCECVNCKSIDDEEGSPSGSLLRFVNRVAERIEKEFPNVAIDTLAYLYTRKPPKITKPRDNVIVRLCSIECSFSQPLETSPQNISFKNDIEGWGKICKRLYVWDYVTNFRHYLLPHPNLRVLQPNIKFFVKNGVKGIFEQGNSQSPGGEFQELRTWLLAKLLWNPDANFEVLLQEFLNGYYGKAAKYIREYIDLIHNSVEETKFYLRCYTQPDAPFLTPEVLKKADELFDSAEKSVQNNPTLLERVQVARLPLLYIHIVRSTKGYKEEVDKLVLVDKKRLSTMLEKFEKIARAKNITHIKEGRRDFDEWIKNIKEKEKATLKIIRLRNPLIEVDVLPELGGRIWRLRYLPMNKDIIKRYQSQKLFNPTKGGYEEYTEAGYRSPGWCEEYSVKERSDFSVTLEANLRNGLCINRQIKLDETEPRIHIISTLTNPGTAPVSSCLRIHPEFYVTETERAKVLIKSKDGSWYEQKLDTETEKGGGIRFDGKKRPEGEWVLVDDVDGIGLVNRFRVQEIDLCYLNWSKEDRRVNLEIWSPKSMINPGESLQIEHSYEVVPQSSLKFLQ